MILVKDICHAFDTEAERHEPSIDEYHVIETTLTTTLTNCLFCGVWFEKKDGTWERKMILTQPLTKGLPSDKIGA